MEPRRLRFALARRGLGPALVLLLAGCRAPAGAEGAARPPEGLRETIGRWVGVRRSAADGGEAAMTMQVRPVLGGAGLLRELRIETPGGPYLGLSVDLFDPERGCWIRRYANAARARFVGLEGRVEGRTAVWRTPPPSEGTPAARTSRLRSEWSPDGRWTRSMEVSGDGGGSWRLLWTDRLRRAGE